MRLLSHENIVTRPFSLIVVTKNIVLHIVLHCNTITSWQYNPNSMIELNSNETFSSSAIQFVLAKYKIKYSVYIFSADIFS